MYYSGGMGETVPSDGLAVTVLKSACPDLWARTTQEPGMSEEFRRLPAGWTYTHTTTAEGNNDLIITAPDGASWRESACAGVTQPIKGLGAVIGLVGLYLLYRLWKG